MIVVNIYTRIIATLASSHKCLRFIGLCTIILTSFLVFIISTAGFSGRIDAGHSESVSSHFWALPAVVLSILPPNAAVLVLGPPASCW